MQRTREPEVRDAEPAFYYVIGEAGVARPLVEGHGRQVGGAGRYENRGTGVAGPEIVQQHPAETAPKVGWINGEPVDVDDAVRSAIPEQCDHVIAVHHRQHRQVCRLELIERFNQRRYPSEPDQFGFYGIRPALNLQQAAGGSSVAVIDDNDSGHARDDSSPATAALLPRV